MSVTALAVPQPRSSPVKTGSNPSSDSSLREVCLTHLNLIHKMSETILEKDRQIKVLKENNSQLLKRLSLLEQISKSPVIAVATTPEPSDVASDIANDNIVNDENENVRKRKRGRPATKDKSVGTGPSQPSVNKAVQAQAKSDLIQENGVMEIDEADCEDYLCTSEPYFTFQGEEFVQEEKDHVAEIMSHAEVPGWREITFSPTYTMEGTENIEDETMLRRHQKLELDEKRRKRWDIQRMREQRHIEKLRARYEEVTGGFNPLNGSGTNSIPVLNCLSNLQNMRPDRSLLPHPDQATHIMIADELPVTAFGYPVPVLPEQEFLLPWE